MSIIFHQTVNGLDVDAVYSEEIVNSVFLPLLRQFSAMRKDRQGRLLIFLAAPPAAGKSTLAAFLEYLSKTTPGLTPIQAIGMDGFHRFQDDLLQHSIERDGMEIPLVRIKGAPVTFDLPRLRERIAAVATGGNCPWPVYDRLLHDPRDDALTVTGDIVLLEGNYLLLDRPGWRELKQYAGFSVFIKAAPGDLRERLIARKAATSAGSLEQAKTFVDFSDLPNAVEVLEHSQTADATLKMLADGSYVPE